MEEDEEKYKDLEIIRMIVREKNLLRGDFESELFLQGKKLNVEKVNVHAGKYEMYLPINRNKLDKIETFLISENEFQNYEAYECEDGKFGIIIEDIKREIEDISSELECYREYLTSEYEDLEMHIQESIVENQKEIGRYILADEELDICVKVYMAPNYRLLVYSKEIDFSAINRLSYKILQSISEK